jgi:hypothetical protein
VGRELAEVVVVQVLGVVCADGDDLVVLLPLVDHGHEADSPGPEERAREDGLLHEHEHVHGVVVLAERARDEAVVVRVHDGGVEHAVHLDEPRLLVQLVLDLAPLGDLHDLRVGSDRPFLRQTLFDSGRRALRRLIEEGGRNTYHVEDGRRLGADLEVVPRVRGDGPTGQRREDALVQPRRAGPRRHLHRQLRDGVLLAVVGNVLCLAHLRCPLAGDRTNALGASLVCASPAFGLCSATM